MTVIFVLAAFVSGFFMGLLCSVYISSALALPQEAQSVRVGSDLSWHIVEICGTCAFLNSSWEDEWACVTSVDADPCPKCGSLSWTRDMVARRVGGKWEFKHTSGPH